MRRLQCFLVEKMFVYDDSTKYANFIPVLTSRWYTYARVARAKCVYEMRILFLTEIGGKERGTYRVILTIILYTYLHHYLW